VFTEGRYLGGGPRLQPCSECFKIDLSGVAGFEHSGQAFVEEGAR